MMPDCSFFSQIEGKVYGYGVSVRAIEGTDENTAGITAREELDSIRMEFDDVIIDVVRSNEKGRPELDKLIAECTADDVIVICSINTLFKGRDNRGLEYYKKILDKGIGLLVFDFSGSVARLSKFSTVDRNGCFIEFHGQAMHSSKEVLLAKLAEEMDTFGEVSGKKNRYKTYHDTPTVYENFRALYVAYEGYTMPPDLILILAEMFCGISSKPTFRDFMAEFERSVTYLREIKDYKHILRGKAKRLGGVPKEYAEIHKLIESENGDTTERAAIEYAIEKLGLLTDYETYLRWHLAEQQGKKKTRVPFDEMRMREFMDTHDMLMEDTSVLLRGERKLVTYLDKK